MKKYLLVLLLSIMSLTTYAKGGIPIFYGDGETVSKVLSLPSREEFMIETDDGKLYHADLGVMYNQFSLFWIPIWNYGEYKYVLYNDTKDGKYDFTYADLDSADIEYLQSLFGGIPTMPELPFWDSIGGKLLLLLIVGGIIFLRNID